MPSEGVELVLRPDSKRYERLRPAQPLPDEDPSTWRLKQGAAILQLCRSHAQRFPIEMDQRHRIVAVDTDVIQLSRP
jgi:hypothetical protein